MRRACYFSRLFFPLGRMLARGLTLALVATLCHALPGPTRPTLPRQSVALQGATPSYSAQRLTGLRGRGASSLRLKGGTLEEDESSSDYRVCFDGDDDRSCLPPHHHDQVCLGEMPGDDEESLSDGRVCFEDDAESDAGPVPMYAAACVCPPAPSMNLRGGRVEEETWSDDRSSPRDAADLDEDDSAEGWAPAVKSTSMTVHFVIAGAVCGISLLSSELAAAISTVIGIAYPAFLSLKALGSGEGVQVERLKRLLAYWVCMGALQISEAILMPLVGGSGVVPKHYNVARLIAIYWMQGGDFSHSTDIYCRWMVPLMASHGAGLDQVLLRVKESVTERVAVAEGVTGRAVRKCVRTLIALKELGATAKA